MAMDIQHGFHFENLIKGTVCNNQTLLVFRQVLGKSAPVWCDNSGTTSTWDVVKLAISEFHAFNTSLAEEGRRKNDEAVALDGMCG